MYKATVDAFEIADNVILELPEDYEDPPHLAYNPLKSTYDPLTTRFTTTTNNSSNNIRSLQVREVVKKGDDSNIVEGDVIDPSTHLARKKAVRL